MNTNTTSVPSVPTTKPIATVTAVFIILGVAVGAIILHIILTFFFKRLAKRTIWQFDDDLVKHCKKPTFVMFPTIGLLITVQLVTLPVGVYGAFNHALIIILLFAISYFVVMLIKCASMAVSRSNDHLKESDPKRAREVETQIVVMTRIVQGMVWLVGMSGIAMTFPNAWQVGVSLLASASVSAILLGFAAKPSIENALASLTIALTQPFLIEDQVQVNGEIGHIEEIQSQYVIVRTLDERRLVVPLTWFLGNIFQNWSRNSPRQIAQCKVFVDYTFPVPRVRQAFLKFARTHPLYDQRHAALLVTGCTETTIELTCQISVANAMEVVQVTSDVREAMVEFISNAQKQQVFSEGSNTGSNPVGGGGGSSIKGRSGGIGLAHTLETIGLLGGGGSEQQNNRPDSPPLPPLPPLTKEDEKMGDGSKAYQCASIKARLAALQKDPSKTTASTTTAADACTTTTPVDTTGMTTARQAAPDHIQVNVEDLTFNSNSNGLTRRSVREVEKVEKDNEKAAMPPETKASEKYQLSEP